MNTTTESSTQQPSKPLPPWRGMGYKQVPGLANRHISRYLRAQRRNMLRFFTERGMLEFAERMVQIRDSRQGMLAKNRMFRKVLDDYAALVMPAGATPESASEAAPAVGDGSEPVGVQTAPEPQRADADSGPRSDAGVSVPGLAAGDADGGPLVVEE